MTNQRQHMRRALEGLPGVPATEGNRVDVLRNGDAIFPAMLQAIREADATVDFATYVYWTGSIAEEFANLLSERARDGVRVRILLDAVGAHLMDADLVDGMSDAGCQVEFFRPPTTWKVWETNHRTHRKVLICDEDVAFTGGVGIAEEWRGDARNADEWRDTHVRVQGPAVDGLRAAFVLNWAETGHPLFDERDRSPEQPQSGDVTVQVIHCPAQIGWSDMASVIEAMLRLAERSVKVTSAYFVPDERFVELLREVADRGVDVDVDVIVPGPHADKRVVQAAGEERYGTLIEAGVRIHRFMPTMIHAKVITVDGIIGTVGSTNFDQRSVGINDEANIVVFDEATTAVLDAHFAEDLARCEPVEPGSWEKRGPVQRTTERVAGLVDGQL